jgi:hypothetical protein
MNIAPVANAIYIGAPIDQNSERQFLASTIRWLEERQVTYIALVNVHIRGRQIDCIVATPKSVSVVEVKSSYLPVRGDLNGTWSRLDASGTWRTYNNAYQQALDAKNALRDEMMAVKSVGRFYPDGHVVFSSGLAEGSQLTAGNYKVTVGTLEQFLSNLEVQGTVPWSLDDWVTLATKLALTSVSLDEAIAASKDRHSAEILRQYNAAFAEEYRGEASRWLPEDDKQRNELVTAAMGGAGCFITGVSGCGKTLMAKCLAVELANTGNPTLFFAAKDFPGSWSEFIRREISLLFDQSVASLLRAISCADRPTFLVLDGINELGSQKKSALRGIRALARRLGAKTIITAQEDKPLEFDGLRTVLVSRPSMDLKQRIARSGGAVLNRATLKVLNTVGSGIEAEIVGQIGRDLKAHATRVVLMDQYIRMRLGEGGRAASYGLRRFSSSLHEQVAFSMAESIFDDFMGAQAVHFEDCDAMFGAGLLRKRAGRISFSHEMIQNACAAFDFAQKAAINPAAFGILLCMPALEGIAGDVVSAIEDAATCRALLAAVTKPALLSAAADGELGAMAESIATSILAETAEACQAEIRSVRLELIKHNDAFHVDWEADGQRNWTATELARLSAIGQRAASSGLDNYLALCAAMDERLTSERQRLAEVVRNAKFPLKSESFALAYLGFGGTIGFTHVSRIGRSEFRERSGGAEEREFSIAKMSSGQLYFFLENGHAFFGDNDAGRFAEELAYLLRERFEWEPYHVQLAILHAATFAHRAPKEALERLVGAIKSLEVSPANWAIGSCVVDALKFLGALDDEAEETREQIKQELDTVLADDDDLIDKDLALSVCLKMFDHPFDSIYADEIYKLDSNLRRRMYRRALGASNIKRCMNLLWLSRQVASFDDASDAPLMQQLATLPDPQNVVPQEGWGGFVVATRFLGRHGIALARVDGKEPADRCLAEIRTLVYAAESRRRPDMEDARLAWQRLHAMAPQLVIGCMAEVHAALTERQWGEIEQVREMLNLVQTYQADCLRVARRFVVDGVEPRYFHRIPHRELGPTFAFETVGHHGDRSDIESLRKLTFTHPFARYALAAIKLLDGVSN